MSLDADSIAESAQFACKRATIDFHQSVSSWIEGGVLVWRPYGHLGVVPMGPLGPNYGGLLYK